MNHFYSDQDERRYLPRWEVRNRILYQIQNSNRISESITKDINANGASFFSRQALEPKQTVKVTIYLSPDISITTQGHIAWSKPIDQEKNLTGVEFENIDEKIQEKILEHAFSLDNTSLMRGWYQNFMKGEKRKSLSKI